MQVIEVCNDSPVLQVFIENFCSDVPPPFYQAALEEAKGNALLRIKVTEGCPETQVGLFLWLMHLVVKNMSCGGGSRDIFQFQTPLSWNAKIGISNCRPQEMSEALIRRITKHYLNKSMVSAEDEKAFESAIGLLEMLSEQAAILNASRDDWAFLEKRMTANQMARNLSETLMRALELSGLSSREIHGFQLSLLQIIFYRLHSWEATQWHPSGNA
jgi:hypothetical protein